MRGFCFGAVGLTTLIFRDVSAANPTMINPAFTYATSPMPATGTRRMEARFSPCSSHIFVIDKSGSFIAYSEVADEATFKFDVKDAVYEVGDHGPTGMLVHPDFPTTPSMFIFYTADSANKWKDSCTMTADADGFTYCDTTQRLQRIDLTVTMTGTRCTNFALASKQTLIEDWCSTSLSHGNGNIEWWNRTSMILTSGDGAQPSQTDYGQRVGDVCFDSAKKLPQGRFRSQRMDFLQGKLLLIKAESLLKNAELVQTVDYNIVAQGLRQPYVNTVNPWTGDVLIGDVGSKQWEEVNLVTAAEMTTPSLWPLNFGWPCNEGRSSQANPTKGDFAWLLSGCNATNGELCDMCKDIWPCNSGVNSANCSASFRPPQFQFRDSIDRDVATLCQASTHALVSLTWLVGSDFSAEAAAVIPYALVGSDYGSGCIFYWDVDATTKRVKFEDGASVLATNHTEGLYLTRGRGGYLYSGKSDITEVNTLWKFGLIGSAAPNQTTSPDPPTATLETSILDPVTNTFKTINCRIGCTFAAGSTIRFDGSASKATTNATITSYKINYGLQQGGSQRGVVSAYNKTYSTAGTFKPLLIVTDSNGRNDTDTLSLNVRNMTVGISMTPPSGAWQLGSVISYKLTNLVASDVKSVLWDATVSHCRPDLCTGGSDCHTHTNGVDAGGLLLGGTLTAPGHAMPSSMTITATITPTTGTAFSVSAETTALQYTATVRSAVGGVVQTGWPIDVVDVKTCFSPCEVSYMAGIASELSEPEYQYRKGKVYAFTQWEAATPGIAGVATYTAGTVPIMAENMTLTAKYTALATVTTDNIVAGPALVGATAYYGFLEVKWTVPSGGGYDWVLVYVVAADGSGADYSTAALATARQLVVSVPQGATAYTIKIAGYNSATLKKSVLGKTLNVTSSNNPAKTCIDASSPYGAGGAAVVPGSIELERFDNGGEGTAYHDLTAGNTGGATFRSTSDVDIAVGGSGGFSVTKAAAGEWLQYTVDVAATGKFSFTFYLSSIDAVKKTIYVMIDATVCNKAQALIIYQQGANTGSATTFVAYTPANVVTMTAGEHTLTLCIAAAGLGLDKMVIAAVA